MARREHIKRKIPEWFNVHAYAELSGMTLKELFNLLSSRAEMFKFTGLNQQEVLNCLTIPPDFMVEMIEVHGLLKWSLGSEDVFKSTLTRANLVTTKRPVNPMKISSLSLYAALLSTNLKLKFKYDQKIGNAHFPIFLDNESEDQYLSVAVGGCPVEVDLRNFSDQEIIAEMRTMLPIWRKELAIDEPEIITNKRIGASTVKNIINYAVLPILDLTIWSALTDSVYSSEQIVRLLYPDPEVNGEFVSSKHFIETRQPFALSFVSDEFVLKRLKIWITSFIEDIGSITTEPKVAEFL